MAASSAKRSGMQFRKFAEVVAEDIRSKVARGELKPGDYLPSETELMETYGIARPTMREALRILESESLISLRRGAHSGPLVQEVDPQILARQAGLRLQMQGTTIHDLVEAQSVLEPGAVGLAAERRAPEDIEALRGCLERARVAPSLVEFAEIAAEFHLLIVRASGNRTLTLMVQLMHVLLHQQYERTLRKVGASAGKVLVRQSLDWYERVIDLIEAGDAEGATELWRRHETAAVGLARGGPKPSDALELYP